MKRISAFLFLLLIMGINAFAQSLSSELDIIKQIKQLESTHEDVKKILASYKVGKYDEPNHSETFSSEKIEIEVSYSTGNCSDDSNDADEWNIEKGRVEFIDISFNDAVNFKDLRYDISAFRKERIFADKKEGFVYHDKSKGIAFLVENEKITSIFLIPSTNQSFLLCKNEKSKRLKEFYSRENYFAVPDPSEK
jgi:hypothetical protein